MEIEVIGLVANLSALSVAGILYAAYIKNLRAQVALKDEQIRAAEQREKLWKDKVLELERQSPQFVEQVLAQRIQIREDEIERLEGDGRSHLEEIQQKNSELTQLKTELEATRAFGRGISVYDRDTKDFKDLSAGDLTLVELGQVWVDSATLMIVDPWHFSMSRERELEDHPVYESMYRVRSTGDAFYVIHEKEQIELEDLEGSYTAAELVEMGKIERLDKPKDLPAFPDTYVKGEKLSYVQTGQAKGGTFINGTSGAGLSIGTGADGMYQIRGETYRGKLVRVFFDLA